MTDPGAQTSGGCTNVPGSAGAVPPAGTATGAAGRSQAPAGLGPPAPVELPPEAVRASLRYSIKDGMAWSVMIGAGERYVQPFVILGGGSLFSLAAIAALPMLAGALVQWAAASVTDAVGRRKAFFVWCGRFQALTWLPICAAIFLPPPYGFVLMLASFVVYMGLHNFGIPAWNSVMGDLVPADRRGRYFGVRNLLVGSMIVVSFLAGGWWLRHCQETPGLALLGLSSQSFGFLTLFLTACVARQISAWYLSRMHEPQYRRQPSDDFSLWQFIRRAPQASFGRFVMYCALLRMGGWVVGPFFNWYILDQLQYSTVSFALIGTTHLIAYFTFQPLHGRLADRFGSKRVLAMGGVGVVGIPLLLMVSDNLYYLLAVMVYDGACWGAFDMAAANYLFDIVTPGKRARCTAYNSVFIALGAALGTFIGATVAHIALLPSVQSGLGGLRPFTLILICSAVLRMLPNLILLRSFPEWRLRPAALTKPIRPEGYGDGPPL